MSRRISWSADPHGVLPGGRCHTSGDAVVQWAVWHDTQGRSHHRIISVVGELPEFESPKIKLSPAEIAYGKELASRL